MTDPKYFNRDFFSEAAYFK